MDMPEAPTKFGDFGNNGFGKDTDFESKFGFSSAPEAPKFEAPKPPRISSMQAPKFE